MKAEISFRYFKKKWIWINAGIWVSVGTVPWVISEIMHRTYPRDDTGILAGMFIISGAILMLLVVVPLLGAAVGAIQYFLLLRQWFETGKDWISATKWGTTIGVIGAAVLLALFEGSSFWVLVTSLLLAAGFVGYSIGRTQQRSLRKSFSLPKDNTWVTGSVFGWVGGQTVAILTIWLLNRVFELFPDNEVMLLFFNIIYWFVFGCIYGAITCKYLHTIMVETE